jgi:hypothetical protein
VQFPIRELKPGAKIKGKTVAELGNRNRPLDMISYQKDGKPYLLLANSSRGIMKIATEKIVEVDGITEPVSGTKGLGYETIERGRGSINWIASTTRPLWCSRVVRATLSLSNRAIYRDSYGERARDSTRERALGERGTAHRLGAVGRKHSR